MFLHKYTKLQDFLKDYPDVSPERLLSIADSLYYASKLLGKTVQDIEEANTEIKLHPISRILHVPNYKHKNKNLVKTETINAFNAIFQYTPTTIPPVVIEAQDTKNIQAPLQLGPPSDYDTTTPQDISFYIDMRPIDIVLKNDQKVPTESSIMHFLKRVSSHLYCEVYRNLKYYKHKYYQYKDMGDNDRSWKLVVSLEDAIIELYDIINKNVHPCSSHDFMFTFLDENDKVKIQIQKQLLRHMEKTVQTFSDLNVTNQDDKETETNMPLDVPICTEEKALPVLLLPKHTLSHEEYCSSVTEPLCKTKKQEQELQQLEILRSHRNNTVFEFFTKT